MPPFILSQILLNIWKYTGTQTSRNFKIYKISFKDWILDHQVEIQYVTPIDWKAFSWTRTFTSHEQVIINSDSVMCVKKMSDHSEANRRWENQVEEFRQSNSYKEILVMVVLNKCGFTPYDILAFFGPPLWTSTVFASYDILPFFGPDPLFFGF